MRPLSASGAAGRKGVGVPQVRVWAQAHPLLVDWLVPLALIGPTVAWVMHQEASSVQLWGLAVAGLLPLVARRRAPVPVFTTVVAIALLARTLSMTELARFMAIAVLIALYTVAAHRRRDAVLLCAGLFEVWVVVIALSTPGSQPLIAGVLLTGTGVAAAMIGVDLRTRRAYWEALEDRAVRLERERDQQAQLAAAAERSMIAREVHDIVAHNLSVMVALADAAAATAPREPERAGEAMRQVATTGREAIREMRSLLGALRDKAPEAQRRPQPGIDQLEELLEQVRTAGLPARLTVEGRPTAVPAGAQLAVYRIVQESLTNIRRHADAPTLAHVRLRYLDQEIDVQVTDDGSASTAVSAGTGTGEGHGLIGMRERALSYGGLIEAGPRAGGGWRVHARLSVGRGRG